MRNDRRRDCVENLGPRIVAQQQPGELVIFDERYRVTVFTVLHRDAHAVGKKLSNIDRVVHHLHRRNQSFGHSQGAGRLQLPGG